MFTFVSSKNAISSSSNNNTIDLSCFTSNNVSVSKTSDAILNLYSLTNKKDCENSSQEVSICQNNPKIKTFINSVCMVMFASWEPNPLLNGCIL